MRKQSSEKLRKELKVLHWRWCRNSNPSTWGSGFTASPTGSTAFQPQLCLHLQLPPPYNPGGGWAAWSIGPQDSSHAACPASGKAQGRLRLSSASSWRLLRTLQGLALSLAQCIARHPPMSFFRATENKEEGTSHSSKGQKKRTQGNESGSSSLKMNAVDLTVLWTY